MKRLLLILAILFTACESRIDKQIRLVNEQAQISGWIDEANEVD